MNKYTVNLRDIHNKIFSYKVEAEDLTQAIKEAINKAFDEMPDVSFRLDGVIEDLV